MAYSADTLAYDVISEMGPRELKGPVWMLGRKYILPKDKEILSDDVRSRIWCSYRRAFRPISGTHLSSDTGWGCTLRCGQMLLAQALLCKKFGREYRWTSGYSDPPYFEILRKFLDIRDSEYSLQMIALQGADFGRQVGQWFGPNNVAQAIKKLAAYDTQSRLAVHVAMDMLVVIDDLKVLAREPHSLPNSPVNVEDERGERQHPSGDKAALRRSRTEDLLSTPSQATSSDAIRPYSSSLDIGSVHMPDDIGPSATRGGVAADPAHTTPGSVSVNPDPGTTTGSLFNEKPVPVVGKTEASSAGMSQFSPQHLSKELVVGESLDYMRLSFRNMSPHAAASPGGVAVQPTPAARVPSAAEEVDGGSRGEGGGGEFRSILLFVPLRLGQDIFNMSYSESLKACLTLPQSVGFIGGRPRHALYFIGYNDNILLYLDPHTTQNTVQVKDVNEKGHFPDSSYHTSNYGRMHISGLDPSIALGFFCKDENDLDDLVKRLRSVVLRDNCLNMFELTEHRPAYWGPFEPNCLHTSIKEPFLLVNRERLTPEDEAAENDDDDFEIIDWPLSLSPAHQLPVQGPVHISTPRYRATSSTGSGAGERRDASLSDSSDLTNTLIN